MTAVAVAPSNVVNLRRGAERIGPGGLSMSTPLPPSPFIGLRKPRNIADVMENLRRELLPDEREDDEIAPDVNSMPMFLSKPSPSYLKACEIVPVLKVIARHP